MNTRPGLIFAIAIGLLVATFNSYGQDSVQTAPVTKKTVVKPATTPTTIKPGTQAPVQQPANTQTQPGVQTQVALPTPPADRSLKGQFNDLLKTVYRYQQPALIEYNKSITDSLNAEKHKLTDAQNKLALQAKNITQLQNDAATLSTDRDKLSEISILGIGLSKTMFSTIMIALVIILAAALAIVIYLSGSNRHEAAYRIKLYEELNEEFKAYKAKANEKEIKLARELQTERNKVEELMGKK